MSALFDSGSGAPFVEQTPAQRQLAADMARRVEQELRRQLAELRPGQQFFALDDIGKQTWLLCHWLPRYVKHEGSLLAQVG